MSSRTPEPILYDPKNVLIPQTGLSPADLDAIVLKLETARTEVLADLELWHNFEKDPHHKQLLPEAKRPLDAAFIDLPERLLEAYRVNPARSELGRILHTAQRLRESVDRVVLLGIGGSYMGARAMFEACCRPYHNELSRAGRGGCPRLYFEGNNLDNDAMQGLLDLLGRETKANSVEDAWAIVVISKSGETLETAVALRKFLAALQTSCGNHAATIAERVVPVTGQTGRLRDLAQELGCQDIHLVPEGVGGRFSVLSAVGLLPAAILGLDIVALLEGAAAMNTRFHTAPPGENPVLDYVAVCTLLEKQHKHDIRVMSVWSKGLEAAGMWYDQLLSESLGKAENKGATPITAVNTRDLHSRGQQHQEGRRDKLITNVIVDRCTRDLLTVGRSERDEDDLNRHADKSLPKLLAAAIQGTNQAYSHAGRPTADIRLPLLDEASLGQFFQMLMLATVVEGRLIGANPYGQPGVQAYKEEMKKALAGG